MSEENTEKTGSEQDNVVDGLSEYFKTRPQKEIIDFKGPFRMVKKVIRESDDQGISGGSSDSKISPEPAEDFLNLMLSHASQKF